MSDLETLLARLRALPEQTQADILDVLTTLISVVESALKRDA